MNRVRPGIRTRLTLVYGSLFLLTSGLLVGAGHLLAKRAVEQRFVPRGTQVDLSRLMALSADQRTAELSRLRGEAERDIAAQRDEVLLEMVQGSLVLMLVLGVLAVVIGHMVAGRVLRPLRAMTATARRLADGGPHERLALDGPPDEVKDLADTFDRMLDRLQRAFDAQRRFVANASHELRTPLTINRTVLEVALASSRSPPETKALADVLLGNTARHERLIEGLLLLARSEREPGARVRASLPDMVRSALDQVAGTADDVEVVADLRPAAAVGDPVLLERCAANLLENALKYNVPGGRVWVGTGTENGSADGAADGSAVLRVANTGPPVPGYEIEAIFEPFRRLHGDRVGSADGAGLGLSIVRAVVRSHGGAVTTVPRPDGGLEVTVRLPAGDGRG
ncbi:sensor histidine kinase [Spirillospora sp. CA-253888]